MLAWSMLRAVDLYAEGFDVFDIREACESTEALENLRAAAIMHRK
jgi:hypothetical protein